MGYVTGIVVIAGLDEDFFQEEDGSKDLFWLKDINSWITDNYGDAGHLISLAGKSGGNAHPQFEMAASGINYGPTRRLREFILSYPWRAPEEVVLIIRPEHGPVSVFRPGTQLIASQEKRSCQR
jgi:hypothetical protein